MNATDASLRVLGLARLNEWREGTVTAFDDGRGLGTLASESGSVAFHCVAIADGTRSVRVGARVRFRLALGPTGLFEARAITPV